MADLLAWMFSVFGFTYIAVYSQMTFKVRELLTKMSRFLGDLVHCPLCLGFWVGLLAHFVCGSPTQNFFFDACLGSISAWVGTLMIAELQRRFEENYNSVHRKPGGCSSCGRS